MSTIAEARAKLGRIAAALPVHIKTTFEPSQYERLVRETIKTMLEDTDLLTDDQKRLDIPLLVNSITVENGEVADSLVFKVGGITALDMAGSNITEIMNPPPPEKIMEWVRRGKEGVEPGKEIDERDYKDGVLQSDEDIARRVYFAMRRNQDNFFGTGEPGHGALNPTGLVAFANGVTLDDETLSQVLLMILQWLRDWASYTFPGAVVWRVKTAIESEIPS